MSYYNLFMPKQAVGANLVYFDLFNASGSPHNIELLSCKPVVSGAVAVVGVLGVDLHLTRTSAVGTGGTAATVQGTDTTAATFSHISGSQPLSTTFITARLTPSGGATAGALLNWSCVFTEETGAATYTHDVDLADYKIAGVPGIIVPAATGIRVIQGAVASVGNIGFSILFKLLPRS
jgi:hypothetical protein